MYNEFYYDFDYGDEPMGYMFGFLASFGTIIFLFFLAFLILSIIGNWKLFEKAGVKGWKSLIPFYSQYKRMQIIFGNGSGIMFLIFLIPYVNFVFRAYTSYRYTQLYKGSTVMAVLSLFFPSITNLFLAFDNKYQYIGPYEPYYGDINYGGGNQYNTYNQGFNNNDPNFHGQNDFQREEYENRYNRQSNSSNEDDYRYDSSNDNNYN